jgi:tetratricopeptide (TPR) repeat protein
MRNQAMHSTLGAAIRRIVGCSAAALLVVSLLPLRASAAPEFPQDAVDALAALASADMDANAKASRIQGALNNIRSKRGRPDLAVQFLDAVLAAQPGLDANWRGRFSCDRISALRGVTPVDAALVERRCRELAEDPGIPDTYRARAVWLLLETQYATRDAAKRAEIIAYARAFLEKNQSSARDAAELRSRLMRLAREAGDAPLRAATARELLSDANAPASLRMEAASNLAAPLIDSGDFAAAEAVLRQPWGIPKLSAGEAANAVGAVARLRALAGDEAGALALCSEISRLSATPAARNLEENLRGELLISLGRAKDAAGMYLAAGRPADAANALDIALEKNKAREIRLKLLSTPMPDGKPWDAGRRQAYEKLLDGTSGNMDVIEKHFDQYANANSDAALRLFRNSITTAQSPAFLYYGDFANALRCYRLARRLAPVPDFKLAQAGITACAGLGDLPAAAEIARDALAGEGLQPAEAYQLRLTARLLPVAAGEGTPDSLAKTIRSASEEVVREMKQKDPGLKLATPDAVERLYRIGGLAQLARRENFARGVAAYVASLRVPSPRKVYRVRYRAAPVSGLSDWDAIPAAERPVLQPMDRAYGGSMDFLETDVTTGSRGGVGTGSAASDKEGSENLGASLGVLCDEFGIHFRFDYKDPRAREIEARLLGGGSYEVYLATGENRPHLCLLIDVQTGRLSFANLTYDSPEYTCIKTDRPDLYRMEHRFYDDRVATYVFLSWNAYGNMLPRGGSVWEFENVLWARRGNFAWNGTESIHGRSTWGRLVFDLPESGRTAILRHRIFAALAAYKAEKATRAEHAGILDFWQDPVLGDPEFYEACVKPLVEKLDALEPLVKPGMSDEDVARVAAGALPGWTNLRHTVDALRRQWLLERLSH